MYNELTNTFSIDELVSLTTYAFVASMCILTPGVWRTMVPITDKTLVYIYKTIQSYYVHFQQ